MTTPTGTIKFSDIYSEFGRSGADLNKDGSISGTAETNAVSLGRYRINQTVGDRNWTLDTGVPSSGSISFGQLRGKTLNVVVDYSGGTEYGVNSQTAYDSNGVVIGGFKSRPTSTSTTTKKVHHVIRKVIGSTANITSISPTTFGPFNPRGFFNDPPVGLTDLGIFTPSFISSTGSGSGCQIRIIRNAVRGARNIITSTYTATLVSGGSGYNHPEIFVTVDGRVLVFNASISTSPSFDTGNGWNSTVSLNYIVASGGKIYGRGGVGGQGSPGASRVGGYVGAPGGSGGNAFSVNAPNCFITVDGGGLISGGGGGGGGGGYLYVNNASGGNRYHGGGGGGGAGLPGGGGGLMGGTERDTNYCCGPGGDGYAGSVLGGGRGGDSGPGWGGDGYGGDGGNPGDRGNNGGARNTSYGTGGSAGYSILKNGFSPVITISSAPRILGPIA